MATATAILILAHASAAAANSLPPRIVATTTAALTDPTTTAAADDHAKTGASTAAPPPPDEPLAPSARIDVATGNCSSHSSCIDCVSSQEARCQWSCAKFRCVFAPHDHHVNASRASPAVVPWQKASSCPHIRSIGASSQITVHTPAVVAVQVRLLNRASLTGLPLSRLHCRFTMTSVHNAVMSARVRAADRIDSWTETVGAMLVSRRLPGIAMAEQSSDDDVIYCKPTAFTSDGYTLAQVSLSVTIDDDKTLDNPSAVSVHLLH